MLRFRELARERPVFGTWSMLGSPTAAEALASSGLDFVVLDLEHGTFGLTETTEMVRAVQGGSCAALVRIAEMDKTHLLTVLETGPDGVLVANVAGFEVAELVVRESMYPPEGTRGISPYTRTHRYTHVDLEESTKRVNQDLFVGVLLEGPRAIEEIDQVVSLDRLDLVYFGIYDFAQSVGHGGDVMHTAVQSELRRVAAVCAEAGVSCGTFARNSSEATAYLELGLGFVAIGADGYVLRAGYESILDELRPREL